MKLVFIGFPEYHFMLNQYSFFKMIFYALPI